MHHTGRVVSRTELVEHLYDQDFDRDSNTIEVFVGRIRKKLGVEVIQTVRGPGLSAHAARHDMRANSLALRLFLSATAWTVDHFARYRHRAVVALPAGGRARIRPPARRLSAHAGRRHRVARRHQRQIPAVRGEPLFELPLSGWYWQVTRSTRKARSARVTFAVGRRLAALAGAALPAARVGSRTGYVDGPGRPEAASGRAQCRSGRGGATISSR